MRRNLTQKVLFTGLAAFTIALAVGLVEGVRSAVSYVGSPFARVAKKLPGKDAASVRQMLGDPVDQWSWSDVARGKARYPWDGYALPPKQRFARVLVYAKRSDVLYVYLDSRDQVSSTFIGGS